MSLVRKTKIVVTTREILIANYPEPISETDSLSVICPVCKSELANSLPIPTPLIDTNDCQSANDKCVSDEPVEMNL